MTNNLVLTSDPAPIVELVLDGLTSIHSKRAYHKALTDFLSWYGDQGRPGLNKAVVQKYRTHLESSGLSASTVNVRMSAIKKLSREAADNNLLDPQLANGISRVRGVKRSGVRVGNWLNQSQAQRMIDAPDVWTLKGLRDRAILALMIGGGLRRSEVAKLRFEDLQQRDSRWVIVDLVGKGNRVRSVPIPSWAKLAVDAWADEAGIDAGRVFRPVNKGDRLNGSSMTPQAIRNTVKQYAGELDLDLAAHDLRRTFAKLAHKGGAGIDQIQLSLGHGSIKTTELYLGVEQDLQDAPCDRLRLKVSS